ncbi:MAG: M23 family metallopeptidase, partial [Bacilli bacterium]|nr:M23 family metallopeptidase [Bacilli bacterium]
YQRIVDVALELKEKDSSIRIDIGIIGATYTMMNMYDENFTYESMSEEVITDLANNMLSYTTTIHCKPIESDNDTGEMPYEVKNCMSIIIDDKDLDGNPANPAQYVPCEEIVKEYMEGLGSGSKDDGSAKIQIIKFTDASQARCPDNTIEVDRKTSNSIDIKKYYDYLTNTFIPDNLQGITSEEIEKMVDEISSVEQLYYDSTEIFDSNIRIDSGFIPAEFIGDWGPVFNRNYSITSCFGLRLHPTKDDGSCDNHKGIDLGGSDINRTEIVAPLDGNVSEIVRDPYCGNGIRLIHNLGGDIYETKYCHLSQILVSLPNSKNPTPVYKGQVIGLVGSTGDSTDPHLHFMIRKKNEKGKFVQIDPFTVLKYDSGCYLGGRPCNVQDNCINESASMCY